MRFPQTPPDVDLADIDTGKLFGHLSPTLPDGRYLHWDELRNRQPPTGLDRREWWQAQKLARFLNKAPIPGLTDDQGRPFWFCRLDTIERATHELDRRDAAKEMVEAIGDEGARHRFQLGQLIEEAISSSVLEGASISTRSEAKAMLRSGRAPATKGERMIWNNYHAMERVTEISGPSTPLELADLLELHEILGEEALDVPDAVGRLRSPNDNVRIEDSTGETWFVPPDASSLHEHLEALLRFANDNGEERFFHPLVRAIVLHFWLAYLHPFLDGNGRVARALFYWQMVRSGYDFARYLSISTPIERSRRQYYLAFVYSETDSGDLTYFILHQLKVLGRATDDLLADLKTRGRLLREIAAGISGAEGINPRQRDLLLVLMRNPHPGVTVQEQAKTHGVTYLTARKDLQDLEKQGLLRRVRSGRSHSYLPVVDLHRKLASMDHDT